LFSINEKNGFSRTFFLVGLDFFSTQEPPYKAIFLALALLTIGTSLLVFGFMILTGYIDAGKNRR
jgi:hypothetical protein